MRKQTRMAAGLFLAAIFCRAGEFRLVRSISGPSGRVQGPAFAFDEVRNRFVYPEDKSFVVYFEWDGAPGAHVLSALWKGPDGRVDSISPDVKMEAATGLITCYWTYLLDARMASGVWAVEIRIDGQPAGSHPFEIAGTGPAHAPAAPMRKLPTLDDLFRTISPSLVWVHKFNAAGRQTDTASGFVIGANRIATAFQAIDGAARLQVEFAGGRRVDTDEILACSRTGDWAIVSAATADLEALKLAASPSAKVGERLVVFNVDGDVRAIGGVDISGVRAVPGFGERIQFSPAIALGAAGGPLVSPEGEAVAVLGGGVVPAARFSLHQMSVNPALGIGAYSLSAATPVSAIPRSLPQKSAKLGELAAAGVLTTALEFSDNLLYVSTALSMGKSPGDPLPRDVGQFSRRDEQVWVLSEWQKKGKASKGFLSARVYDSGNRVRVTVPPRKLSLYSAPTRFGFSFAPAALEPGTYRVDLLWDEQAVWRTFIRISD